MGRRQQVPFRKGSVERALAGDSLEVVRGRWGSPGGRLKISSLFGCIGETAVLLHPKYTWECGGNSYCEELALAREEEQHPSISETGTWHLLGPNFWGRNSMLVIAAA